MYKDILLSIAGIEVFPAVSLVLFVVVFAGVLIKVARMGGARAAHYAALPLQDTCGGAGKENLR